MPGLPLCLGVMADTPTRRPGTLGSALERQRIDAQTQRIERAIEVLRTISERQTRVGPPPRALEQAIERFAGDLDELRRRRGEL